MWYMYNIASGGAEARSSVTVRLMLGMLPSLSQIQVCRVQDGLMNRHDSERYARGIQ
jgi:hypothetical protein